MMHENMLLALPPFLLNIQRLKAQKKEYETFFDKENADIYSRTQEFIKIMKNIKNEGITID